MKLALCALVLACMACGDGGGGGDAGTEAGGDADDADAGGLVVQCQAQAQKFAALCGGSAPRPCVWNAYAELCKTGDTQLLVDAMNCLNSTTCRTFSDPNEGATCLDNLLGSSESSASKQWLVNLCTSCGGTNCSQAYTTAEIFPYLTDSDVAALSGCQVTACTLDTLIQACASTIPDVNLFLSCTQ